MNTSSMTRRGFVRGAGAAALAAGAAASTAMAVPVQSTDVQWDAEYDVVVVGAGAGGFTSSIELAQAGLSVGLFEWMPAMMMSSSYLCGGYFTCCETDLFESTADELYNDLIVSELGGNDYEYLARTYVDNASEMYYKMLDWGVTFQTTEQAAYMSKPWSAIVEGNLGGHAIDHIAEAAAVLGVEPQYNTRVMHLVVDHETGRVVGVTAETDEGTKAYGARLGVILACGGFTQNHAMAKKYGKKNAETIVANTGQGNWGDGINMALEIGADTAYIGAGVVGNSWNGVQTNRIWITAMTTGSLCINLDGKRFANEGDNYTVVSTAALDQPHGLFFQVYDSYMRGQLEAFEGLADFGLPGEPEYVADTIEGLADAIAVDYPELNKEAFVKTIQDYNGYVDAGEDLEFGRKHVQDGNGVPLTKFENAPYYAIPSVSGTAFFSGGLKADKDLRVLGLFDDAPIEGLYACGEIVGGMNGYGYMCGANFGKSLIWGMVGARTLMDDSGVAWQA